MNIGKLAGVHIGRTKFYKSADYWISFRIWRSITRLTVGSWSIPVCEHCGWHSGHSYGCDCNCHNGE